MKLNDMTECERCANVDIDQLTATQKKLEAVLSLAGEMHNEICEHLSRGLVATERDGEKFDWYSPMQDGTMASFLQEIAEIKGTGNDV